jgi:hypothetical protein
MIRQILRVLPQDPEIVTHILGTRGSYNWGVDRLMLRAVGVCQLVCCCC